MKTAEELYGSEQFANPSFKPGGKPPQQPFDEQKARNWAVRLTGDSRLKESSAEPTREHLTDWLANSAEGTLVSISVFPEAFQTTRSEVELPTNGSSKAVTAVFRVMERTLSGFGLVLRRIVRY